MKLHSTDSIKYGSKTITYKLYLTNRTKTVGITISPQQEVIVKSPSNADINKVKEFVKKKAPWIISKLTFFDNLDIKPTTRQFLSGESHYYLGKQYRLKVIKADKDNVVLKRNQIVVETRNPGNELFTKHIMSMWYWHKAQEVFDEKIEKLFATFNQYKLKTPTYIIAKMKSKWGQCDSKGKIKLNKELIKMPSGCIDYVITHEFCHLKEHNHSDKFYALLNKHLPTWKKWKERLESNITIL